MAWINAIKTKILESPPSIEERILIVRDLVNESCSIQKNISAVLATGIDIFVQPSDAVAIASGINAESALCATINNSCASFSSAVDLAIHKIMGQPEDIAVVTSSSIFKEIHRDYRSVACSNGVGAAIVSNDRGGLKVSRIIHKRNASYFGLKAISASRHALNQYEFIEMRNHFLWNSYRQEAIDFPVQTMRSALSDLGWSVSDVDHWIFHSSELTECWISALGLNLKPSHTNCGALTGLAQLDELMVSITLNRGDRIAMLELGLGMCVSVILLESEGFV